MRFSMPTNFDPLLIEQAKAYPVDEVYGKLTTDVIGGGRLSQILPSVYFSRLRAHLALCRMDKSVPRSGECYAPRRLRGG